MGVEIGPSAGGGSQHRRLQGTTCCIIPTWTPSPALLIRRARTMIAPLDSRLLPPAESVGVAIVGEAIARAAKPPRVWLNASSATIYKHTFDTPMDEAGETGAELSN